MSQSKRLLAICWLAFIAGCSHNRIHEEFSREIETSKSTGNVSFNQYNDLCLAGIKVACALIGEPIQFDSHLPILQGYTDQDEAFLAVLVSPKSQIEYLLIEEAAGALKIVERKIASSKKIGPAGARQDLAIERVHFDQMKIGLKYQLWLIDQEGKLLDRRYLSALDLDMKSAKVAVASCLDDAHPDQEEAWKALVKVSPDLLILLGDNVYADRPAPATPASLWNRYLETRERLAVFRNEQLLPTIATWDDHDFGQNDGDMNFPYAMDAKDIFEAFFPKPAASQSNWVAGPGVAQALRAFGQQFILLDDRTYRTPNRIVRIDQSHLGSAQVNWMKSQILEQPDRLAWLMEGDQFFGDYHNFESFAGSHPDDFRSFVGILKSIDTQFVLVSGDRHLAELMNLSKKDVGQKTWEVTTSGLHAKTFSDALSRNPNPRMNWGVSGPLNFLLIQIYGGDRKAYSEMKLYSVKGGLLHKQKVTYSRPRKKRK